MTKILQNPLVFFCPISNFLFFQYFCMIFCVESHLIPKRSFPRYFWWLVHFWHPLDFPITTLLGEKHSKPYRFRVFFVYRSVQLRVLFVYQSVQLRVFFRLTKLLLQNPGGTKSERVIKKTSEMNVSGWDVILQKKTCKNIEKTKS